MTPVSEFTPGKVAVIGDWNGPYTGIGRYWRMLHTGLREAGVEAVQVTPAMPPLPNAAYRILSLVGRDLEAFLTNYPLWCWYPDADIYHLGQQALTSLLLVRRPRGKVVVTVHDIFPHVLRRDPWFKLALLGLSRADHLIAISDYTKQSLIDGLGISSETITVVYHGIDHERFKPLATAEQIRKRYRLPEGRRYLIYVGSEDTRKDLVTLVRAVAEVRHELPEVELIKVGRGQRDDDRLRLVELAGELGVLPALRFVEDVAEEDLPLLYNLAELYVTPSPYEGFGFPLLEAMACGTPVVYADAGSLPEIAGGAGVPVAPGNPVALAAGLLSLLRDKDRQASLRAAGLQRAASFTWSASTQNVLAVYRKILHPSPDGTEPESACNLNEGVEDRAISSGTSLAG